MAFTASSGRSVMVGGACWRSFRDTGWSGRKMALFKNGLQMLHHSSIVTTLAWAHQGDFRSRPVRIRRAAGTSRSGGANPPARLGQVLYRRQLRGVSPLAHPASSRIPKAGQSPHANTPALTEPLDLVIPILIAVPDHQIDSRSHAAGVFKADVVFAVF